MRVSPAEVAPLAPLLIPLGELLVWAVALAFCLLAVYIAKALFGTASSAVGWIPLFGKVVSRSLTGIEHKIVSFLSQAAISSDAKVGAAFHELARVVDWLGHEIATHANLINTLARLFSGQRFADQLAHVVRTITGRVSVVEHTADIAIRRIDIAEKRLAHGIGEDVLPRVKSLEREYAHVVEHDIASLRARERALEDGALATFRWIRAHSGALASTAFAGAVAWALARLGAGWIRCSNWRGIGSKVCGLPSRLIEDLLAGVIDVLVIADLCQLTKVMVTVAESAPVQDALNGIIAGIDDLLLCQGVDLPPALDGYWTDAAPSQPYAALPAV